MPYSITDEPPGMITLRFEGLMTLEIVLDATADVVQVAKEQGCFRVLTDIREATVKLSMVEVYNLPNLTADIVSTAGLRVYQFKRAIVISAEQELLPFFENVSRNRHQNVRLFQDVESARQWLLEV
jgi:hypothetical protein